MSKSFKEYVPTAIDKQLLVWYKKFPSRAQVPPSVNESMMKMVQQRARVHGSLILMGLTIVGYIYTVADAKRAVRRGETMEKINEEIHRRYQ